jgi:hypothetical protein
MNSTFKPFIQHKTSVYREYAANALLVLVLFILTSSCTITRKVPLQERLRQSPCNQKGEYNYSADAMPTPLHQLQLDTILTNNFSVNSLNIANAGGMVAVLEQFAQANRRFRQNPTVENNLLLLNISDKLKSRVNLVSLEISAVAAEMDCEEEQTDQIADFLNRKERTSENRLTAAAILTGAATAITAALLLRYHPNDDAPEVAGIVGGFGEAILGAAILVLERKVEHTHPRNPLREVWKGEATSTIFPPSVWYYLLYQNPEDTSYKSFRQRIIDTWKQFDQLDDDTEKKKRIVNDLYFGDGGKYNAEELENRANMYDQLEAHINLMQQDLMLLSQEIDRLQ